MSASQISTRHFGRKVVAALARRGIRVIGLQAIPDERGSFLNSTTGYVVDDRGCGCVWSYREVLKAAR
jgi:hypothetical protein